MVMPLVLPDAPVVLLEAVLEELVRSGWAPLR
jgi:hypothetical protein